MVTCGMLLALGRKGTLFIFPERGWLLHRAEQCLGATTRSDSPSIFIKGAAALVLVQSLFVPNYHRVAGFLGGRDDDVGEGLSPCQRLSTLIREQTGGGGGGIL